jgi:hypothetical protein
MSGFDRFCAVLAEVLGAILLLMGVFGLFAGIQANFRLPPVLGLFPAFVGWGVIRSVMLAWNVTTNESGSMTSTVDQSGTFGDWGNNSEDDRSQ